MTRATMPAPARTCHRCGGRVSTSGRRTDDGVYFCVDPECQAAKARRAYADRMGLRADAPTTCSGCGVKLKPRKVRANDSPTGLRWCPKPACRRDRAERDRRHSTGAPVDPQTAVRLAYLHAALALPRVICPTCEREDAVDGYPHFDPYGERCSGTGDQWVHKDDVKATYPNFAGLPATLVLEEPRP